MTFQSQCGRLASGLLLAGIACSSHAQFSGNPGGMRGNTGGMQRSAGQFNQAPRIASRREEFNNRFYELRVQLLIEPGQAPAFEKFRASYMDLALAPPSDDDPGMLPGLQQQIDMTARRLVGLQRIQDDTQALLAVLKPEQAQIAVQALAPLLAELSANAGAATGRR